MTSDATATATLVGRPPMDLALPTKLQTASFAFG
jgi:hypothetical protein